MTTALSEFLEPTRAILCDSDPDVHLFEDEQLLIALRSVLKFGKVPDYGYNATEDGVDPELTWESDAVSYFKLCLHAAGMFVRNMTRKSINTRGFSQSIGQPQAMVDQILQEIYESENGEGCLE